MPRYTNRQTQILDAALELIADQGMHGLTIRTLAGRLGITEPAIYRHFPGKSAILGALLERFSEGVAARRRQAVEEGATPLERIGRFLRMQASHLEGYPAEAAIVSGQELFRDDDALSLTLGSVMRASQEEIAAQLHQAREDGLLRDDLPIEDASILILGGMRLTITRWRMEKGRWSLQARIETLWETLTRLLEPPGPPPRT